MDKVLKKQDASRIRVFTVWEKVLRSDGEPPLAQTLARVSTPRAIQFWDPERAVSKQAYGEKDEDSIVWDCVYLYPPFTPWTGARAPGHNFTARPVVDKMDRFEQALAAALRQ
jgi:hypothetical protein